MSMEVFIGIICVVSLTCGVAVGAALIVLIPSIIKKPDRKQANKYYACEHYHYPIHTTFNYCAVCGREIDWAEVDK